MKINKESALKLWDERYGKQETVKDYAGRIMTRSQYDQRSSSTGFNIDHIFPISLGGTNDPENLILCNIKTNDEKANRTSFITNGMSFQVKKVKGTKFYHIVKVVNQTKEDNTSIFENPIIKTFWIPLFGEVINANDFTNRPINVNHFNTNDPDGWTFIKANPSVVLSESNYLIVNKKIAPLIEGKNNFKIDDINYTIIKTKNNTYSVYSEDLLDSYNPSIMEYYFNNLLENKKEWTTHLAIILDRNYNFPFNKDTALFNKIIKFSKKILDLEVGDEFNYMYKIETSHPNFSFIRFSFSTPTKENANTIKEVAKILNSYFQNILENYAYRIILDLVEDFSFNENSLNYVLPSKINSIFVNELMYLNTIKNTKDEQFIKEFSCNHYDFNVVKIKINEHFKK